MWKFIFSIAIFAAVTFQQSTATGKGVCSATGDPHYSTFDGRVIHFQGKCQYVLAKDVNKKFTVLGKNVKCGNSVTCTSEVTIKVKDLEIVIKRGGAVTVFGIVKSLPYAHRGVTIKKLGTHVEVTTDVGLKVDYDCVYNVYIVVSGEYRGKTRGICGNFNGNKNDLVKSDNSVTANGQEFANSWKVDQSCPNSPPPKKPCKTASAKAKKAKRKCRLLRRYPFSPCHNHVNVHGFIKDCKYDVCACKDNPESCLCEEYDAYATTCQIAGVNIQWKQLAKFIKCATPCALAPCLNGGTCRNVGKSYRCTCPTGFKGTRCEQECDVKTISGNCCVFPFVFSGKTYCSCTRAGSYGNKLWCATTNNYDRDRKWGKCQSTKATQCNVKTTSGNRCVFPFVYNGKTYCSCTRDGNYENLWCATTNNYDRDRKWRKCQST